METFLAWKDSFEREMNAMRAEKARQEAAKRSKLSGRELFQKDNTLVDSDIKFLEDGEMRGGRGLCIMNRTVKRAVF